MAEWEFVFSLGWMILYLLVHLFLLIHIALKCNEDYKCCLKKCYMSKSNNDNTRKSGAQSVCSLPSSIQCIFYISTAIFICQPIIGLIDNIYYLIGKPMGHYKLFRICLALQGCGQLFTSIFYIFRLTVTFKGSVLSMKKVTANFIIVFQSVSWIIYCISLVFIRTNSLCFFWFLAPFTIYIFITRYIRNAFADRLSQLVNNREQHDSEDENMVELIVKLKCLSIMPLYIMVFIYPIGPTVYHFWVDIFFFSESKIISLMYIFIGMGCVISYYTIYVGFNFNKSVYQKTCSKWKNCYVDLTGVMDLE